MSASITTLGEHIATQKGFAFKSGWFCDSGRPVVKVKDFTANSVDSNEVTHVSEEIAAQYLKYQLRTGDVVIQTVGSWPSAPASVVGKCVRIPRTVDRALLNQNAVKVSPSSSLDGGFLYYSLKNPAFGEYIVGTAQGAASQAAITLEAIRAYKINLPDLPTQRKIAGILSAYDDLIENNLRRIKILEAMAQSLYREWFVHFRFPGHESACFIDSSLGRIPKGWEVRKILDFADVIYGFSFKANRFNTAGEGVPVVRIRNIQDGKSETYSEEEGDPKHRVKNGDILVGMDGDFHMTIWSGGDAWQNQRVAKFRPKGAMGNYLLFLALEKPIHYFDSTITGTTVAHLGDSHIKTIEFPSPPEALMRKASDLLEPMAQEQLNLRRRNQTLRRTRDLLLPKLLAADQNLDEARP